MSLAHTVGVPEGSQLDHAAAVSYLDLLDRVLEDRQLSSHEVGALAAVAAEWDISEIEAGKLHRAYVAETWRLAEADGVVTRAELRDIEILAELLGVPTTKDASVAGMVREQRSVIDDWEGKSVCFTGDTQCCIGGHLTGTRRPRGVCGGRGDDRQGGRLATAGPAGRSRPGLTVRQGAQGG